MVGSVQDDDVWEHDSYPPDDDDDVISTPTAGGGRKRGKKTATPRRILAKENERKALEMRKTGMTYEFIGIQLGLSTAGARACVLRAMEQMIQEPARELIIVQYERLNHMLLALWPQVNAGERGAISEARMIMQDMNRLMGADAPQKLQVSGGVDVTHGGAIAVVDIDEKSFIAEMQKVIYQHEAQQQHANTHGLPGAPREIVMGGGDTPDYLDDEEIIEAEVIDVQPKPARPSMMVLPKEE